MPTPIITPQAKSTEDILYGSRETSYRWEVLTHQIDGTDTLAGYLAGVEAGSLDWTWNTAVKGAGSVTVDDLPEPVAGMLRVADIDLVTARLRPVLIVKGLPETPLGVFIISAAPETWSGTGRSYTLELHDRSSVLDQDGLEASFVVDGSKPVLEWVRDVIVSAGEAIMIDATETRTVSTGMVWVAGTSKLTVVNELLDVLGYNGLQVDGDGEFLATPYARPASRPVVYDELEGLPRELIDGETSVYSPDWSRDRDSYKVPNKVIALSTAGADVAPLTGIATNENPDSPYSYQARGRWITSTLSGVQVPDGTDEEKIAELEAKARQSLIASSSPQSVTKLKHLPLPLRVGDVLRFANTSAHLNALHVVTHLRLDCTPTGLMDSTLQEVLGL